VVPGIGSPSKTWSPTPEDQHPSVTIKLSEVNGVPAGDYPIIQVELTPVGELGPVTVKIVGKDGNVTFEVSLTNICEKSFVFLSIQHFVSICFKC